jgi:hypothetical protein
MKDSKQDPDPDLKPTERIRMRIRKKSFRMTTLTTTINGSNPHRCGSVINLPPRSESGSQF